MGWSLAGKRGRHAAMGLALMGAILLAGCRSTPGQVTGLRIIALWTGVTVDQLQFSITNDKGDTLVDQQRRPRTPASPPLKSGADVVVYFADSLGNTPVKCDVQALFEGKVVATARFTAQLQRSRIVDADAELSPGLGAKVPGAACGDPSECESGYCVDGVCCQTECAGACRSCGVPGKQGTCTLVPEGVKHRDCADQGPETCGYDGTCDGLGTCRRHPAGTRCAAGTCTGSSLTAAGACDGNGSCLGGPAVTCAPFGCDPTGPSPHCFSTCTGPAQCVPGRECLNNSCGKKLPGASCTDPVECVSNFCVDGFCCDSKCDGPCLSCGQVGSMGVCRPVPAGVKDPRGVCVDQGAASCGTSGSCDGGGGCARYVAGTICKAPTCMSATVQITPSRCDGTGACIDGGSLPCAPYACSSTTGACQGSCASNGDCAPGIVCMAQSCGKKGLGQPCQAGLECASTFCVDKVCCADSCQGPCRSCALGAVPGTCTLALAGAPDPRGACKDLGKSSCDTDGACNGNGACRKYAPGTTCAAGSCNTATNQRILPAACDSKGACVAGAPISCGAYRCNGTVCFAGCGSDNDCVPPNTCLAGACGQRGSGSPCAKTADCASPLICIGSICQLAPLGYACTADNECSTGQCAEGVCCESDSCGPCRSCKLSGSVGFCQPVPAGATHPACVATPASSCGRDGTCNGAGACRFHPAGTQCAAVTCNGKDRINRKTCDGMGVCQDNGTVDCAPFLCNPATSDCFRSCSSDNQCCCGNTCRGNNVCN